MTDYGSGTLGDFSGMQHSTSTNWTQPRVAFLGDSTGNRGRGKLAAMLLAEFDTNLAYDCWSGCPMAPLIDDLLERNVWPEVLLIGLGTNNFVDPPSAAAQIQRVLNAAPETTTVVWIDTYVARTSQTAAVQLHDVRNSGWVNQQIHAALPTEHIVKWNAALGYAVGRGRAINYYLQDGVHQWQAAGTTPYSHGNGVDFWAEIVMQTLRPLLAA
jgi:hypothetical protein